MGNDHICSLEDDTLRGKYAREISWLLGQSNINWYASPSVKKPEIFIRPKDPPEESLRSISRVSLQVKDNSISLGVSGYFPWQIKDVIKVLENKGYQYHDKGYTANGKLNGRWWLTKSVHNIDSLVDEFKNIEPLISKKD